MVSVNSSEPVVRVRGFGKRYKRHVAVRGVDLTVRPGEMYGLIGPDGAGKSSLMKAIAGVLAFEEGEVEVFDVSLDSERAAERIKPRLGFMPQGLGLNLYPELSVEENIDFFARLRLVPERELASRKDRLLAMTRLAPFRDRAMKHLSGGMKQKLGLVCTLIHEPDLIILDEPTTGVDPVSRRDFWAILSELVHERGLTALVSTAYMDEASRFHRLSLLFQGRVLASGDAGAMQAWSSGTVVSLETGDQVPALDRLKPVFPQTEAVGSTMRIFVEEEDGEAALRRLRPYLDGLAAASVRTEEPDPEDVFVALVRRQGSPGQAPLQTAELIPSGPRASGVVSGARWKDETAVVAKELVRDFGSFRAVDRVSFQIRQGEIFGLLGANGAGKTTVIKMLTGILRPTGGEGWVAGADMRRAGITIKERIGYMSQAFSLYLDMTVCENIRLFAGIYGLENRLSRLRAEEILDLAGLRGFEFDVAGRLPMGVRQRLALGCALVHRPRVLFLDEPTSGVDPLGRRQFWEILLRLSRKDGVALLVTTHYMSEAEHCDHLALMYAGRVVADASPAEMKQDVELEAGQVLEVATDRPVDALSALVKAGFAGASLFGTRIHLLSRDPVKDEARIGDILARSGATLRGVRPRPLMLEDVFVHRVTTLEEQAREPVAPIRAGRGTT